MLHRIPTMLVAEYGLLNLGVRLKAQIQIYRLYLAVA